MVVDETSDLKGSKLGVLKNGDFVVLETVVRVEREEVKHLEVVELKGSDEGVRAPCCIPLLKE